MTNLSIMIDKFG